MTSSPTGVDPPPLELAEAVEAGVGPGAPDAAAVPASDADRALVRRILDGDEEAFLGVVDAHHALMLRVAATFVSNRAMAEEVVQETWVAVLEGLARFEGRSALKTWIFRILANRARTRAVREGRSVPFSALGEPGSDASPVVDRSRFDNRGMWSSAPPRRWDDDTPELLLSNAQLRAVIERAIDDLPANQRAVIAMRDLGDYSSEEVCNVLGITETNQRVLLHRARSKVRAVLEKHLDGK